jgi:hypothetical protein
LVAATSTLSRDELVWKPDIELAFLVRVTKPLISEIVTDAGCTSTELSEPVVDPDRTLSCTKVVVELRLRPVTSGNSLIEAMVVDTECAPVDSLSVKPLPVALGSALSVCSPEVVEAVEVSCEAMGDSLGMITLSVALGSALPGEVIEMSCDAT